MSGILNAIILVLASLMVLGAILSAFAALRARTRMANAPYGVGRQRLRQSMQINAIRTAALIILALILFGVYGLRARPDEILSTEPDPAFTPPPDATATLAADEPTATPDTPTPTLPPATSTPTPSAPEATATSPPTETPTITPTSEPTAVVTSEVGLYLREAPGGTEQLELLPVGTTLVLLDGQETVDGDEWREVRAPSGAEGWVAVDFIDIQP